jgi:hypothetical protein
METHRPEFGVGTYLCRCHGSSRRRADSRFSIVTPMVLLVPGFSLPALPKITRRDFDRLCIYVDTAGSHGLQKNLVFRLNVDVTSNRLSSFASIDWAEGSSSWGQFKLASVPCGFQLSFAVPPSTGGVDTETP